MKWNLVHEDVAVTSDSGVISKTYLIFEKDDVKINFGKINKQENHVLGTKRVLVDAANMLKRLAHEMESKADRIK